MMNVLKSSFRFCILFAGMTLASGTAPAQEEEAPVDSLTYEKEDVVVVGTRSRERIIDIPYSVFTIDPKELEYGRRISARDVLADVPGLFLQSRYGNHDIRISLRGFGTRSNSGVRGVRILQDGIPVSEPDGETITDAIDFTSLGGVEVVKGNLSSLYSNAPGGVIDFQTGMDFDRNYLELSQQAGGNGMNNPGGKFGFVDETVRLQTSYHYLQIKGYRPHSQEYQHLVNLNQRAQLNDRSSLEIIGNYADGLNRIPGSLTAEEFAADPFQAWDLAVSQDFRRVSQKGQIGVKYKTHLGELSNNEIEVIGYGGIKELEAADPLVVAFSTRNSLGTMLRYTNRTLVGQDRRNVFTAGMDYAYRTGVVTEFDNIAGMKGPSVVNEYRQNVNNLGFYALDKFDILPELLEVLASVRWDRVAYERNIAIPFGFTDTSRSFQKIAPKIGVTLKLTNSIALYSSYGQSYDFPSLEEMRNSPLSSDISTSLNPDLMPQRTFNFETGFKGRLRREEETFFPKIEWDITYFDYRVHDEIVPFTINQKEYFRNAAQTLRRGVEIGFKSEPLHRVELTVNYTFTHFRYNDYSVTLFTPSGTTTADYSGNTVPSVPEHLFNFILAYELELSEGLEGLLLWDCDYVAGMFVNDDNTASTSPYFYANAMVGLKWNLDSFEANFYGGVNNMFDRRYVGFININDFNGRYYETGEPRTGYAGISLRMNY